MLNVCEKHWQFELFRAKLLPAVVINEVKKRILYQADNPSAAKVELSGAQALIRKGQTKGRYTVLEVKAYVENRGQLPTHVARGASLPHNREDVVWLLADRDKVRFLLGTPWQRLGVLEGQTKIPVAVREETPSRTAGQRVGPSVPGPILGFPAQRLQAPAEPGTVKSLSPSAREVTWVIAVEGTTPLKVVVSSQKGGTKIKDVVME
ncbi:MAG: hypothetical protein ACUVWQ_06815 [Candidatus Aminicenantales bacterium]